MANDSRSSPADAQLRLVAPLDGWALPLAEVPDPVFAGGMAGDGVAIDPTGNILYAPCDGIVALMGNARHALTVRTPAGDVLLHVGIDTVRLGGEGFSLRVADGAAVRAGQALLEFDLDSIVRRAPSAITPILLTGAPAGAIAQRASGRRVAVGDFLCTIAAARAATPIAAGRTTPAAADAARSFAFRVPFDHGLHARPAARVAAALGSLDASVTLQARGREADARSTVAMMALGVERGEVVTAIFRGPASDAALAALSGLLNRVVDASPAPAPTQSQPVPAPPAAPRAGAHIDAVVASRGLAVGNAAPVNVAEPAVGAARGDAAAERERLGRAIEVVGQFLGGLAEGNQGTQRGVLEAHRALLADPSLQRQAGEQIERGASAGAAWRATLRAAAGALAALDDARMAERRADLLDIERQVLRVLAGAPPAGSDPLPEEAIVLAPELLPSQLLTLDASRLAGLCMAQGGATSHVAIMAAALGIPTLVAAGEAVLAIGAGTPLILDAEAGRLQVDPPAPELEGARARIVQRRRERERDMASASQPALTHDGVRIHVYCNLGAAAEAAPAVAAGAEGCGLLRTEFLFLDRAEAPDEAEQCAHYQAIATALAGRTLTIRTLDAGGDKPVAYLPMPREENPALGLRGLRTSQAHPGLLAAQLRAIMRVEPAGQCRVLLPMVTEVAEVHAVRALLAGLAAELGTRAPALGVMIETPASALLADQLCAHVDFLSIGSNDLSQYTLAMDRLHPTLAARLDALHPAVLRLIERAAAAGTGRGIEVGVCGGLASDPLAVPLLLGLGVRELSAVPAQIPRLKSLVRRLSLADCAALARAALELEAAAPVRELVREWSARNG